MSFRRPSLIQTQARRRSGQNILKKTLDGIMDNGLPTPDRSLDPYLAVKSRG